MGDLVVKMGKKQDEKILQVIKCRKNIFLKK